MSLIKLAAVSSFYDSMGFFKIADALDHILKRAASALEEQMFEDETGAQSYPHPLESKILLSKNFTDKDIMDVLIHHGYERTLSQRHLKFTRTKPIPASVNFDVKIKGDERYTLNSYTVPHGGAGYRILETFKDFLNQLLAYEDFVRQNISNKLSKLDNENVSDKKKDDEKTVKLLREKIDFLFAICNEAKLVEQDAFDEQSPNYFSDKLSNKLTILEKEYEKTNDELRSMIYRVSKDTLLNIVSEVSDKYSEFSDCNEKFMKEFF